jgi:hypothetical protein
VAWCVMFGPHGSLVPIGTILEIGACQLAVSDGARPRVSESCSGLCVSCHPEVGELVRLAGFEPATCCSGGNRSIHLSYRRP